jgi:hypothetical protein
LFGASTDACFLLFKTILKYLFMKKLLFLVVFFLLPLNEIYPNYTTTVSNFVLVVVQFEDDGDGPPIEDPPSVPIDDWLGVMFLAGIVLSGYVFYSGKKLKS